MQILSRWEKETASKFDIFLFSHIRLINDVLLNAKFVVKMGFCSLKASVALIGV
jgi:hypothetical protein